MEGDGTISMKIFAGSLAGGTILIFLAWYLPVPLSWYVSVGGAVIVSAGLLWISTRRIHMRAHAAEEAEKQQKH
jgi:hypothetical protein